MALSNTTKKVLTPITTGEYTATFSSMRDGKTPADTILNFHINELNRSVAVYVNNSRVIYTDDNGEQFTSEDFFFVGLKRQLKMYDEVSPLEVLRQASETPVTLWVIADEYTNVYSSKPKSYDAEDLGL